MTVTPHRTIAARLRASALAGTGLLTLSTVAALLLTMNAQAQNTVPAAAAATQVPATQVAAAPRYSARDIAQAFAFIDANKDDRISREEASGFRGVARHFDEADANKDSVLSREEFGSALSGEKSR